MTEQNNERSLSKAEIDEELRLASYGEFDETLVNALLDARQKVAQGLNIAGFITAISVDGRVITPYVEGEE